MAAGLEQAAEWAEARAKDRAALRTAFAYPAIVAATGVASVSVMVGWVLPRFAEMLAQLDQTPPRLTTLILNVADVARASAIPALVVIIVGGVVARAFVRRQDAELSG